MDDLIPKKKRYSKWDTKKKIEDAIGTKIGMLTVLRRMPDNVYKSGVHYPMVEVICDCGNIKSCGFNNMVAGCIYSCGCVRLKQISELRRTHGLSSHPLFVIWDSIKSRCYREKCRASKWYLKKGVTMCDEWLNDFKAFYDWCMANGWKKGLHVDKDKKYIEKHGGKRGLIYSPEYCSILTGKENERIKSNVCLTIDGVTQLVVEWAEQKNFPYKLLIGRISAGWETSELFKPVNSKRCGIKKP